MILVPTNLILNLEFTITNDKRFTLNDKVKKKLTEKLVLVWIFIHHHQIIDRDTNKIGNNRHFTSIHKDDLINYEITIDKKRIRYNELIDILVLSNSIVVNHCYSSDKKFTKSYRINNTIFEGELSSFSIDVNKLFKDYQSEKYWVRKYPEQKNLINDVYNSNVDLIKYMDFLNDNIGMDLKPKKLIFTDKNGNKIAKRVNRILTNEIAISHFIYALKYNLKNVWFATSEEGRFYSSASNLPSTAVPFLMIKNKETESLDVSNSQPLLLCMFLSDRQIKYKEDTQKGVFYNKVAVELGVTRNEFKSLSYEKVFFNNNQLRSGRLFDALEIVYPGLIGEINELKEKFNKMIINGKEYNLARELQKKEAEIFVGIIGDLTFSKLLRHDQVVVNYEFGDIVRQELNKAYNDLGLNANFS